MNKNSIDRYKDIVLSNSLLDPYQRDAMLDGVEEMPEEYLEAITGILTHYDDRAKKREQDMQKKILAAFENYHKTIQNITTIGEDEKQRLLAQADTLRAVLVDKGKNTP